GSIPFWKKHNVLDTVTSDFPLGRYIYLPKWDAPVLNIKEVGGFGNLVLQEKQTKTRWKTICKNGSLY
ncbi:MAG: hypothetical protein AAF652_19270, partial [Cyanobacteria bacterium P01_C01_bin.72]